MTECLICYDEIFLKPISALPCGHSYHRSCIESWFSQSRRRGQGECPQCKQTTTWSSLRHVSFEEAPPLLSSNLQLCADWAASNEQRRRRTEEACEEHRGHVEELQRAALELEASRRKAQERKEERRRLEEEFKMHKEQTVGLHETLRQATMSCAEMREHLDRENQKQLCKMPTGHCVAKEEDADAKEERRRLRQVGGFDRLRFHHRSVLSSRAQQQVASQLAKDRQKGADAAEADLLGLKKEVQALRVEVEKLEEQKARQKELKYKRSLSDLSDGVSIEAVKRAYQSHPSPTSSQESATSPLPVLQDRRYVATPSAGRKPLVEEDEDAWLFAPTKLRRTASAGFGKARGKPVVQAPTFTVETRPKSSSLKELFKPC